MEYRKPILTNAAIVTVISLIPGLKISVDGFRDKQNRLVADTIMFSGDDLKTAESISGGTDTHATGGGNQSGEHRSE
jgi:hypothetical protein